VFWPAGSVTRRLPSDDAAVPIQQLEPNAQRRVVGRRDEDAQLIGEASRGACGVQRQSEQQPRSVVGAGEQLAVARDGVGAVGTLDRVGAVAAVDAIPRRGCWPGGGLVLAAGLASREAGVEAVGARAADQMVCARAAFDGVVARSAVQAVGVRPAGQLVVAPASNDDVVAEPAAQLVWSVGPGEDVVARPAVDDRATTSEPCVDRHRVVAVTEIGEPSEPDGQRAAHDHGLRLAAAAGLQRSGRVGDEKVGTVGAQGDRVALAGSGGEGEAAARVEARIGRRRDDDHGHGRGPGRRHQDAR
jgi:hypothetical protein